MLIAMGKSLFLVQLQYKRKINLVSRGNVIKYCSRNKIFSFLGLTSIHGGTKCICHDSYNENGIIIAGQPRNCWTWKIATRYTQEIYPVCKGKGPSQTAPNGPRQSSKDVCWTAKRIDGMVFIRNGIVCQSQFLSGWEWIHPMTLLIFQYLFL